MSGLRKRGEQIRHYLLDLIDAQRDDFIPATAEAFGITTQAVHKHIRRLIDQGFIVATGERKNKKYRTIAIVEWENNYALDGKIAEDEVWRRDLSGFFIHLPENVQLIWHYCFTEMFNNAIDHSSGSSVNVYLRQLTTRTYLDITDNGVGIFNKIQQAFQLLDERQAIVELTKGKLTTDSENHTGEGIFFTSRMVDYFSLHSGQTCLIHQQGETRDWIIDTGNSESGTSVAMNLANTSNRKDSEVFSRYSTDDDFGFTRTVVPVRLAQYSNERLVSRSQAKRLLSRIHTFKTVIFDFEDVESVGQAFADEIFRVFSKQHPEIELLVVNDNKAVKQMISRARVVETFPPPESQ